MNLLWKIVTNLRSRVKALEAGGGGGVPYLTYVAEIDQSGTSNPTALVRENTLGVDVTWTRAGAGFFQGTFSVAFDPGVKIWPRVIDANPYPSGVEIYAEANQSGINIYAADSTLYRYPIEIRIYP